MKTTQSLITTSVRILIAVGLTCLLAGCTAPNGKLAGAEHVGVGASSSPGSSSSGQSDSGQQDYREILAGPGPF